MAGMGMETQEEVENADVMDPREMWNLGIMACFHRRLILGDKITDPRGGTITADEARLIEKTRTCPTADGDEREPCIVLPVYGYEHSGIAVSVSPFSCPWDSGRLGIIYAPHSRIRECNGAGRVTTKMIERAEAVLISEVEEYNRYLQG